MRNYISVRQTVVTRWYLNPVTTVSYLFLILLSLTLQAFRIQQEIRPFRKIDDSFKKIVITKDIVQPYYDEYGILTINIYDFLLNPECLQG